MPQGNCAISIVETLAIYRRTILIYVRHEVVRHKSLRGREACAAGPSLLEQDYGVGWRNPDFSFRTSVFQAVAGGREAVP